MKKSARILNILLLIGLVVIVLSGCQSDAKEPDDQVYTLVIGVDKGISNKLRLTVQFPTYKGSGGGSSGQKSGGGGGEGVEGEVAGTLVETVEASTIPEGINLMNTSTSRRISMIHAKAIIFSEELAREGVGSFTQVIARYREGRRIMQVIICKGTAQDFIKENKAGIGESMAKTMELMETQADDSGFFPRVSFQTFYSKMLSIYEQSYAIYAGVNNFENLQPEGSKAASPMLTKPGMLPGELPRKGGRKIEIIGTAVFNGQKMVGVLNSYETRYFQMVTGDFQRAAFTVYDKNVPGNTIPLDIRLGRQPKIKARFENGIPIIDIKLNIEADIGAVQSRISYEEPDKIEQLNTMLKDTIEDGVRKTIERAQKEWNLDIFTFGRKVAHNFGTIQEFESYNWLKHFKDARVNVDVEANVRRSGLMYESAPLHNNEGIEDLAGGK